MKELVEQFENKDDLKEFAHCAATDLREWADVYR
jgi:hypothetical protein